MTPHGCWLCRHHCTLQFSHAIVSLYVLSLGTHPICNPEQNLRGLTGHHKGAWICSIRARGAPMVQVVRQSCALQPTIWGALWPVLCRVVTSRLACQIGSRTTWPHRFASQSTPGECFCLHSTPATVCGLRISHACRCVLSACLTALPHPGCIDVSATTQNRLMCHTDCHAMYADGRQLKAHCCLCPSSASLPLLNASGHLLCFSRMAGAQHPALRLQSHSRQGSSWVKTLTP